MKKLHRKAVQQKRQFLTNELIRSGIYKKNNKHLYEWTMSELETEYQYIETNRLESGKINEGNSNFQLK
ncbi:Fur-regulated basic protein FbpA [Bacillus sp. sid0103]|uniref:Fur-regulated basic protein FbpA n=1 Tax=Bacillus sp. sid0103 TaxID=2856337 RepID=UPI001C4636CD|nr:Fur-regulated basic protein FbpA [Bacillus sp. sid0103]MBV7507943.1 Fur-regulated basic protein FbpA [Bacillus sp. sid0103]